MESDSRRQNEVKFRHKRISGVFLDIFFDFLGIRALRSNDSFESLAATAERMGITPRDVLGLAANGVLHIYCVSGDLALSLTRRAARKAADDGIDAVLRSGTNALHLWASILCAWTVFLIAPHWANPVPVPWLVVAIGVPALTIGFPVAMLRVMLRSPFLVDVNSIKTIDTSATTFLPRLHLVEHVDNGLSRPAAGSAAAGGANANVSRDLILLCDASKRFWANADRDDRGTHPTNEVVSEWLVEHGMSGTMAKKGASLIRPEWAPTGRRPEE